MIIEAKHDDRAATTLIVDRLRFVNSTGVEVASTASSTSSGADILSIWSSNGIIGSGSPRRRVRRTNFHRRSRYPRYSATIHRRRVHRHAPARGASSHVSAQSRSGSCSSWSNLVGSTDLTTRDVVSYSRRAQRFAAPSRVEYATVIPCWEVAAQVCSRASLVACHAGRARR